MKLRSWIVKTYVLTILITYNHAISFAQDKEKIAIDYFNAGDKKDALRLFKELVNSAPQNAYYHYMLGRCYEESTLKKNAPPTYLKALELDPNVAPDILYRLGRAYHLNSQFNDAIKFYQRHKKELTEDKANKLKSSFREEYIKCDKRILECENARIIYQNAFNHKIYNIGNKVNTEFGDYTPSITADNNMLVFTSKRPGGTGSQKDKDNQYFEDVWYSVKHKGEWTPAKNMGPPINSEVHDGCIAISPDGKELFLYKTINGGDIYFSKKLPDGTWSKPEGISKNINSKYKEPSVSISADGKSLYFSSDRPGGFGGLDIYRSVLTPNGEWSEPVNLGSLINTEYDEDSPFIDVDGKTLYFSSSGHNNIGGYDIFSTTYDFKKKRWSEPVNIGYPINSPDDDIYFTIAGDRKTAYFASAKTEGFGEKDIYKIQIDTSYVEKSKLMLTLSYDPSIPIAIPEPVKVQSIDTVSAVTLNTNNDLKTVNTSANSKNLTKTDVKKAKSINDILAEKAVKDSKSKISKTEEVKNTNAETTVKRSENENTPGPKTSAPVPQSPIITFKGKILDHKTKTPLTAEIFIKKAHNNEKMHHFHSKPDGSFLIKLEPGYDYAIEVEKDGYLFYSDNLDIPKLEISHIYSENIELKKPVIGEKIILNNVFFKSGSPYLNLDSRAELDILYEHMMKFPKIKIEIGGHTDNSGSHEVNHMLSELRAKAVYEYLVKKGIQPERLSYKGYGEEKPITSNDTEEGRQRNRRTEFEIIGN